MSYFTDKKKRRAVLAKLKKKMAEQKDQAFLNDSSFSTWDEAFDILNNDFFKGRLPKIRVYTVNLPKAKYYGIYKNGFDIKEIQLNMAMGLSRQQLLGVLLHEMCHHSIEVKYGHGTRGLSSKRIIGHGKEWKAEMRRVGYVGKVTRFSGKERFISSEY